MGKSTKTYEERIQEKDLKIEKLAQELKRYEAQKKQLEKRRKEEERRIRTHHLIEIGAAVESVLGRCIEIAGIMQRVKEKAGERNERIRKLMERRQSFEAVRGLTDGERTVSVPVISIEIMD